MKKTTDLWFAAFLKLENYKVSDFKELTPHKFEYYFNIDDDIWKELKLKFQESKVILIKHVIDELKDLVN